MPKYRVTIPYACFVTVETEADNEATALDNAYEDGTIGGFCGNDGSDKLIGVTGRNVSIEAGEGSIEGIGGFEISVEEID